MTALLAMSTLTMGGCAQSGADTSADGRTELVFWYSGGKTAVGVWDKLIAEFNASQELYTVTGVTQADYDETYQKVQAGIASKTAADVVLLDADKARNLAEKKLLEDISVYVKEDSSFEKEDY
ncbi:MAG: extracellular solute-binding protein, partial [Lachnospiraceae bacterium]|nr:extracellular solute-binding protein [Lachnospiraceae bacterium]